MQKIKPQSVMIFSAILTMMSVISIFVAGNIYSLMKTQSALQDFAAMLSVAIFIFNMLACGILSLRLWLKTHSIEGASTSKNISAFHIYQMHYLLILGPLLRSSLVPVPMTRMLYRLLGARIGENTYTAGVIYDAHLVNVGDNTLLGEKTLLTPHQMEGSVLSFLPIRIGSQVTIGAHSVILPDVIIEDNAMVAAGSVVIKGTHIRRGEIWGGVPARKLSQKQILSENETNINLTIRDQSPISH
jgi:acetyltransferase-like isoleucine patch superfamily enzyme